MSLPKIVVLSDPASRPSSSESRQHPSSIKEMGSGDIPEHWRKMEESRPTPSRRYVQMRSPVRPSRRLRLIWWAFVTVVTAAYLLISFAEVDIANWLLSKVGVVVALVSCGLIFSALLWIASRLDD